MVIAIASLLAMAMYNIHLYVYKIVKNRYVATFVSTVLLSILLYLHWSVPSRLLELLSIILIFRLWSVSKRPL